MMKNKTYLWIKPYKICVSSKYEPRLSKYFIINFYFVYLETTYEFKP